jgi:hypothetical protein
MWFILVHQSWYNVVHPGTSWFIVLAIHHLVICWRYEYWRSNTGDLDVWRSEGLEFWRSGDAWDGQHGEAVLFNLKEVTMQVRWVEGWEEERTIGRVGRWKVGHKALPGGGQSCLFASTFLCKYFVFFFFFH